MADHIPSVLLTQTLLQQDPDLLEGFVVASKGLRVAPQVQKRVPKIVKVVVSFGLIASTLSKLATASAV